MEEKLTREDYINAGSNNIYIERIQNKDIEE